MTRWLLLPAALLIASAAFGDNELDRRFSKDVLIVTANTGCHRFDVYLALDDVQRGRGLMFVRELPATTGMLFVYGTSRTLSMWMKNTFIPLDMVFARPDGTVINVITNTEPQSLKSLQSTEPGAFVLELVAGTAERLAIDEDSRIYWEPAHSGID